MLNNFIHHQKEFNLLIKIIKFNRINSDNFKPENLENKKGSKPLS